MWAAIGDRTKHIAISYDISCQHVYNLLKRQALLEKAAADSAESAGNVEGAGGGS